jgi:hypothetical protein
VPVGAVYDGALFGIDEIRAVIDGAYRDSERFEYGGV